MTTTDARPARIETWKGIAAFVLRSERWCRHMANLPVDPLPVFKVGGIVCLLPIDFDEWVARRRVRDPDVRPEQTPIVKPPTSDTMGRPMRCCSHCRQPGHNSLTCPERP